MVRERIAQLGKIENVLAMSRQQGEASVPTHRVAGEHSGVMFRHGFLDDIRGRTDIVLSSAGLSVPTRQRSCTGQTANRVCVPPQVPASQHRPYFVDEIEAPG